MDNRHRLLHRLRTCHGMTEVLPRLYVGSRRDAHDRQQIEAKQITHIVAIHDQAVKDGRSNNRRLALKISDACDSDILMHIHDVNQFVHDARLNGGIVLVHCLMGVSRSAAFVVAYMMSATGSDYWSCIDALTTLRPSANPNNNFRMQLRRFEKQNVKMEHEILTADHAELKTNDHSHLIEVLMSRADNSRQ